MQEKEKRQLSEFETGQVAGGEAEEETKVSDKKAIEVEPPRLIDDGNAGAVRVNPMYEYTCSQCGKKYTFRQPGFFGSNSAIMRKCPYCGGV